MWRVLVSTSLHIKLQLQGEVVKQVSGDLPALRARQHKPTNCRVHTHTHTRVLQTAKRLKQERHHKHIPYTRRSCTL